MVNQVVAVLFFAVVLVIAVPMVLRALIRARLKGYRIVFTQPDPKQPEKIPTAVPVVVIGAGLAGLTAAITLARRGFQVKLLEAQGHLGGKVGSWSIELDGERVPVSHGFHAFFPGYYNLNRLLDSLGARRHFKPIDDYVILGSDGTTVKFGELSTTPVFNLLSLARTGVFSLRDALKAPGRDLYGVFLEYDEATTFAQYDSVSFERFNELARVSPGLRLAFNTFARAFFADGDRLSLAELIKSFHFYYLSHDGGLVYDMPTSDFETSLLTPMRNELTRFGATIHTNTRVQSMTRDAQGFEVNGERFAAVVLATDVVGAREIVTQAEGVPAELKAQFEQLRPGQRYAVLRLWLDTDMREGLPVFVITQRIKVLDAVTAYHRVESEAAAWVKQHQGSVIELHCYSVPDELEPAAVESLLISEMIHYLPELKAAQIKHRHFQLKRDFTAFHVGHYANRPTTQTGVPGLVCAGDWVKLPFPSMLMEAACASGVMAANEVLRAHGVREEQIDSVPLRGLMAGLPQPPGRRILSAR